MISFWYHHLPRKCELVINTRAFINNETTTFIKKKKLVLAVANYHLYPEQSDSGLVYRPATVFRLTITDEGISMKKFYTTLYIINKCLYDDTASSVIFPLNYKSSVAIPL